jgi:predicted AAA+ superfamily ATPase
LIDPFTPGIFSRETKHQKFYFFDCGIARAAQGVRNIEDIPESKGFLFETIILNELRTYIEIKKKNYRIYYYAVPNTGDLDFIVETKRKSLSSPAEYYGIEVKLAQKWSPNFEKLSAAIHKNKPTCLKKIYAVYTGKTRLTRPSTTVLPVNDFVAALWDDELF